MLPRTGKAFDFVCLSNSKKPWRSQRSCPGDAPSPFQAGSNWIPQSVALQNTTEFEHIFFAKNGRIQNSADEEQLDFLESMNDNKQASMLSELDKRGNGQGKHAISLLPKESREILSLKFEEQSYKEIAQATGLSIGNVGYKFITL